MGGGRLGGMGVARTHTPPLELPGTSLLSRALSQDPLDSQPSSPLSKVQVGACGGNRGNTW